MHTDLSIQIGTSASDLPAWWTQWGPLIGVAVGALLAGVFSIFTAWRTHRSQLLQDALKVRRSEYFVAMDACSDMKRAILNYATAIGGRTFNPKPSDHSPAAEEMRRKDQEGAAAIMRLDSASFQLERQVHRIQAIGSAAVSEAVTELDNLIRQYFIDRANDGPGVMKAARVNALLKNYDAQMKRADNAIRHDLQVDKIYRSRTKPERNSNAQERAENNQPSPATTEEPTSAPPHDDDKDRPNTAL